MDSPRGGSVPDPEPVKSPAPVTEPRSNFEIARAYAHALSTAADPAELIPFLEPDVVGEELPNLVIAEGATRDRDAILSAWLKSREMWCGQRFDLLGATGGGSQVAMEIRWTATSAADTGLFRRGQPVEAKVALFLKFNDQRIVRQRAYFCFGPAVSGPGSRDASSHTEESRHQT
jgi:ketosteroid isomerase-like protein